MRNIQKQGLLFLHFFSIIKEENCFSAEKKKFNTKKLSKKYSKKFGLICVLYDLLFIINLIFIIYLQLNSYVNKYLCINVKIQILFDLAIWTIIKSIVAPLLNLLRKNFKGDHHLFTIINQTVKKKFSGGLHVGYLNYVGSI